MSSPAPAALTVRSLAAAELSLPIGWAAAEGWNPGLHDALAFQAADPGGFLIGELASASSALARATGPRSSDEHPTAKLSTAVPVTVISAVRTGADFGFLGFYITASAFRGRGYGLQIWNAALARLAGRTIGLDGVVARQANYAKSGFVLAHRNLRYGGLAPLTPSSPPPPGLLDARSVPFADLVRFDATHFGCPRPDFLHAWINLPESRALVHTRDGVITGFGVVRRCREGCKIGPLFAATDAAAHTLFTCLARFAPGAPLFLDPPEPNTAAVALARRHGLAPVFETARMYRGPAPALPLDQIYGITSFELG